MQADHQTSDPSNFASSAERMAEVLGSAEALAVVQALFPPAVVYRHAAVVQNSAEALAVV